MSSFVLTKDNKSFTVKNLGWLLRHWKEIKSIGFNYCPDNKGMIDGELIGKMKDSSVYFSDFASLNVCWNFLNRSIFKGLPFCLKLDNFTREKHFTIGNDEWKRINKLEYKEFMNEINK